MSDREEVSDPPKETPGEKKKRGRPRNPIPEQPVEPKPKRPRGRPKGSTNKHIEPIKSKKPRGRPRKAAGDIVEKDAE